MWDITSLWVFIKRNERHIQTVVVGLLLFAAGWQLGGAMSPYYAAHPIIFEDRECAACASSGGSIDELKELQQEGIANRRPTTPAALAPQGQVLGQFVASVNSNLYHDSTCGAVNNIKEENRVWFSSTTEAEAAGYSPSKCTQDKLGI